MKCYLCDQEASVAVREQAMVRTLETTKFYCKDCYDRGRRDPRVQDATDGTDRSDDIPAGTMILCPRCGTKNLRTDNLCRQCDADLSEAKKRLVEEAKKR